MASVRVVIRGSPEDVGDREAYVRIGGVGAGSRPLAGCVSNAWAGDRIMGKSVDGSRNDTRHIANS